MAKEASSLFIKKGWITIWLLLVALFFGLAAPDYSAQGVSSLSEICTQLGHSGSDNSDPNHDCCPGLCASNLSLNLPGEIILGQAVLAVVSYSPSQEYQLLSLTDVNSSAPRGPPIL